jgi:hypothetical protein
MHKVKDDNGNCPQYPGVIHRYGKVHNYGYYKKDTKNTLGINYKKPILKRVFIFHKLFSIIHLIYL